MEIKYKIVFIINLLIFSWNFTVFSQYTKLSFRHLTSKEGLPYDNNISAIIQDSKGFLWLGSEIGLHRYDGYEFKNYYFIPNDPNSLCGKYVFDIFEDKNKKLWISTEQGLDLFDSKTGSFKHIPIIERQDTANKLFNAYFVSVFSDKYGNLYTSSSTRIFKVDTVNLWLNEIITDINEFRNLNFTIHSIFIDKEDILWVGTTSNGLLAFDNKFNLIHHYQKESPGTHKILSNYISSLVQDKFGDIWVATDHGLNKINKKSLKIISYKFETVDMNGISNEILWKIYEDRNGNIWICTDGGGLNLYDRGTEKFIRFQYNNDDASSICGNKVRSVLVDRQGFLWVSTIGCGINYTNLNNANSFYTYSNLPSNKNSIAYNIIGAFCEDEKGNIWIGTDGGGLDYFDRKNNTYKHFIADVSNPKALKSNAILALLIDKKGDLWVGTYKGGLSKFNHKDGTFTTYRHDTNDPQSISSDNICSIIEDKRNNLLVLTLDGGLNIFDRQTKKCKHFVKDPSNPNSLCHNWCMALYEDKNGYIWIGTYLGLSRWNVENNQFTNFFHQENNSSSLSNNWVFSILEDSKGNMWFGTDGGLNLFDPKTQKLVVYSKRDGFPNEAIKCMLEDSSGNFWIGTNAGLLKFNPETKKIFNFDITAGLLSDMFSRNSSIKCRNGEYFYGTTKGYLVFRPEDVKENYSLPEIVITDLKIFDKSVKAGEYFDNSIVLEKDISETKEIIFTHNENSFSFEFSALDFASAGNNTFAYKMQGFDKNWRFTGSKKRFATYTNLSSGKYIFKVKAANNNGIWNDKPVEIGIKVLSPWWQRWWAYLIYISVLSLLLYIYVSIATSQIRLKKDLFLEKIKHEKEEEVNQMKLDFFTNISHEFRTPLTLILSPLEKIIKTAGEQKQAIHLKLIYRNAIRLLRLINQILDISKLDSDGLKLSVAQGDIINFVKEVASSFSFEAKERNIDFEVIANESEILTWFDHEKLDKIVYNLIANAFKFTADNGKIRILISKQKYETNKELPLSENVEIIVEDTGVGISPEALPRIFERFYQSETSVRKYGTGIGLALVKQLIELHKGDIKVNSRVGEGTKFILHLPLEIKNVDIQYNKEKEIKPSFHIDLPDENFLLDIENTDNKKLTKLPILLVVEDNSDLRLFIRNEFTNHFRVVEANDGWIGFEKAISYVPDIIISDIMMPKMDGIELCQKLKSDERTSHIPIILLTARSSEEQVIEGLETGADDYLTKPFSTQILKARVKNLIKSRKELRRQFGKLPEMPVRMIMTSTLDQKFIERTIRTIEQNLSNNALDAARLSSVLGMSRSQLYRKIKALTDYSVNELIRNIRLKKATELLVDNNHNVTEISYAVGFNDVTYFIKCFAKVYGVTPSKYILSLKKQD